jgi:allantoate deiminase
MSMDTQRAVSVIARCRELAALTDVAGETTRLYLSPATREAHALLTRWMRQAGLDVRTDDIGNVRGVRHCAREDAPTLVLFSHIDTVPNAGAFDGPLGVMVGLAAIEEMGATPLPFHIELIALSEEEGVRFAFPFLSALALTGQLMDEHLARVDKDGVSVVEAVRAFGLDAARIGASASLPANVLGAVEVHIEQGPVLESEDAQLAVVETIAGQSRLKIEFVGTANHAGTTPMSLRHDALVVAAQFIVEVERYASSHTQLVATVGRIEALPGAMNVAPGRVMVTLDVRHPKDEPRQAAVTHLLTKAESAGAQRGVKVQVAPLSEQKAVPMDRELTMKLHKAAERAGFDAKPMVSGAGHDSMVLAPYVPTTMLFVRSPGGISHNPAEDVREQDVAAALATLKNFLLHLHPHS